jgi:hypothetical protein
MQGTGDPERIAVAGISPSVLEVVGVQPVLGRGFREDEATAGNDQAVLLPHGLWTRCFGADPAVLGTAIVLDDQPVTVFGVMPPRFEFPPDASGVQLWRPLAINTRVQRGRPVFGRGVRGTRTCRDGCYIAGGSRRESGDQQVRTRVDRVRRSRRACSPRDSD